MLHPRNLMKACRQAVSNKGSSGIDGMTTKDLKNRFRSIRPALENQIKSGVYLP